MPNPTDAIAARSLANSPAELTGAQVLWETLVRVGVDVVFGYPGGANMPIYDALAAYPVRHVRVRHEQGAAHMADAYARVSGRVGVAMATSGPGATNRVTGIANAMLDSIPAELQTARQEGLKVNVAIINNGYLGMVRQWQEFFMNRRYAATPISSPDFVKLAEAHGLKGIRVVHRAEVARAVKEARDCPDTTLIDFRVEPEDNVYPMVAPGAALDEMIRRPSESGAPHD